MATYIMLARWTDQGIRNAKESPNRLDHNAEEPLSHHKEVVAAASNI
jgi:uncharacterized protein with GYD domain